MVHHQRLLEEKEKWKAISPMKCRYPTLWHASKPSCDCATSQIRYLKKKKTTKTQQHLHLLQPYHLPQSISVQVELVLCLCPRRAAMGKSSSSLPGWRRGCLLSWSSSWADNLLFEGCAAVSALLARLVWAGFRMILHNAVFVSLMP